MQYRPSIRKFLFATLVSASPFVFYFAGKRAPELVGHLVIAAWVYYAVCAVVLRSPIIAGVLAAPFVLSIVPALGPPTEPSDSGLITSCVAIPSLGALGGWICQWVYVSRRSLATRQSLIRDGVEQHAVLGE